MSTQPFEVDEEWEKERSSFGWLGRVPSEIINSPSPIVQEWKKLSRDARRVARMNNDYRKVAAAKKIEERRNLILEQARKHNES